MTAWISWSYRCIPTCRYMYFLQKYDLLYFILHWEEFVHLCSYLLITVNNVTDGSFHNRIYLSVLMYDAKISFVVFKWYCEDFKLTVTYLGTEICKSLALACIFSCLHLLSNALIVFNFKEVFFFFTSL